MSAAQEVVTAPLPGRIVRIGVNAGDAVEDGDTICVIEAMKMENPIVSPVKGSVKEVSVSPGQAVKTGERLAVIEY
ncbi:MAG: biotin/lipoyl-containing protein [Dehalococcoidia bacterium]